MTPDPAPPPPPSDRFRRPALFAAGLGFTGLAAAGVLLPLVPTTPFLLLAAACFARSSPRFHAWLLANRTFGPYLRQWRHDRTIPRAAKRRAYGLVVLTFAVSIALVQPPALRAGLVALGILLLAFLARLPTTVETGQRSGGGVGRTAAEPRER